MLVVRYLPMLALQKPRIYAAHTAALCPTGTVGCIGLLAYLLHEFGAKPLIMILHVWSVRE